MNQTEFNLNNDKPSKNKAKVNSIIQNKTFRLTMLISLSIVALIIVFFISFYISYSKIAADKQDSSKVNNVINQQKTEIERLEGLIEKREQEIEDYKLEVEIYEKLIKEMEGRERTVKENLEQLQGQLDNTKSTTPQPPKKSDVQEDLYIN